MAETILQRLLAPRSLIDPVLALVADHIRIASLPQMRPAKRDRFLRRLDIEDHLTFHEADCLASHGDLRVLAFARQALAALPPLPPAPLVTGADVLALGIAPGPRVGQMLRRVTERVEAGDVADRSQALALLRQLANVE
jgi:poly(A) polymerase